MREREVIFTECPCKEGKGSLEGQCNLRMKKKKKKKLGKGSKEWKKEYRARRSFLPGDWRGISEPFQRRLAGHRAGDKGEVPL